MPEKKEKKQENWLDKDLHENAKDFKDAKAKWQGDINESGITFSTKVSVEVVPELLETQNKDIAVLQPLGVPLLHPSIKYANVWF